MLEQPFNDLYTKLTNLRGAFRHVQISCAHDDALTAEMREMLAALDALMLVCDRARKAARLPVDVDTVRRALPRCQRQLSELKARFRTGLGAPVNLEAHQAAGRVELAWHIGRCQGPLHAAEWAISACWSKLGEYSVLNPGGAIPGFAPPGP